VRRNLWQRGNFHRVLYVIYNDNKMVDARLCVVLGRESVCVCVLYIERKCNKHMMCISSVSITMKV
jgi:hypothetical protein